MRRFLGWVVAGMLAFASGAFAETLTKQERKQLIIRLQKSEKMAREATKGLTPEQWKFRPAPNRWSVQDCLEHLTLAEELALKLNEDILKSPPERAKDGDETVFKKNADRSIKTQALEQLRPTGRWKDPEELLREFRARRKRTIEYVKTAQGDLRGHALDGIDGYQEVLAAAAHTERHVAQMLEVKADLNFPKK